MDEVLAMGSFSHWSQSCLFYIIESLYKRRNHDKDWESSPDKCPTHWPTGSSERSGADAGKTVFPVTFSGTGERHHTSQLFCWLKTCTSFPTVRSEVQFGTTAYLSATILLLTDQETLTGTVVHSVKGTYTVLRNFCDIPW